MEQLSHLARTAKYHPRDIVAAVANQDEADKLPRLGRITKDGKILVRRPYVYDKISRKLLYRPSTPEEEMTLMSPQIGQASVVLILDDIYADEDIRISGIFVFGLETHVENNFLRPRPFSFPLEEESVPILLYNMAFAVSGGLIGANDIDIELPSRNFLLYRDVYHAYDALALGVYERKRNIEKPDGGDDIEENARCVGLKAIATISEIIHNAIALYVYYEPHWRNKSSDDVMGVLLAASFVIGVLTGYVPLSGIWATRTAWGAAIGVLMLYRLLCTRGTISIPDPLKKELTSIRPRGV